MLFHEAVEKRLISGAPHQLKLHRAQIAQAAFDGRAIDQPWQRAGSFCQRIMAYILDWR